MSESEKQHRSPVHKGGKNELRQFGDLNHSFPCQMKHFAEIWHGAMCDQQREACLELILISLKPRNLLGKLLQNVLLYPNVIQNNLEVILNIGHKIAKYFAPILVRHRKTLSSKCRGNISFPILFKMQPILTILIQ